jgi:TonB dependent receptor
MRMVFILILLTVNITLAKTKRIDNDPFLTRVKRTRLKKTEPPLSANDHIAVLQQMPGIILSQQGGLLGPVDIKIRGLSSTRLSIEIEGINLVDPVSGLLDINDLPFFVTNNALLSLGPSDSALSGKLTLILPTLKKASVVSRVGFGSFKTGRSELIAGDRLSNNLDLLFATQVTTTAGNFFFSPTSIVTDAYSPLLLERLNNDQNRWVGLLKISESLGNLKGSTFLFAKIQEGGIAGMSMAPLHFLRSAHKYIAATQKATYTIDNLKIDAQWQGRIDTRETWQKNTAFSDDQVAFVSTQASLSITGLYGKSPFSNFTLNALGELTSLMDSLLQRQAIGLKLKIQHQIYFTYPITVQMAGGFRAVSDTGILPNSLLHFSLTPSPAWKFGLRLAQASRAPTFLELYAPKGLVLGNSNLKAESSYEAVIDGQWEYRSFLQLQLSGFYGFLSNGIFYFNHNAFEISPLNTEGVHRAGLETQITITPRNWFTLEGAVQFNATQLVSTQKPLPNVPGISSTCTLRLGDTKKISVWLKTHYRSSISNNFFGTLTTPAYLLLDASLKLQLHTYISLHFSISNIFNNLYARDSNQFPLPGRTIFALLELTS